ncbi:30S ribosomal protein S5 [Candidatus Woesearchaeota archaeon CG10_big_fil_rev_8_21_14_0_10_37_12]|nr:MAG: 30S ribosomal protein S5 [Candidatus Woesearchaeota archaeon CG10_big_fil_rev_8_21_14_0_10_37_12]
MTETKIQTEKLPEIEEETKLEIEPITEVEEIVEVEKETKPQLPLSIEGWKPKTSIGKKVLTKEITDIDEILDQGSPILEEQIVDMLLPIQTELLMVGQSKGKFGGGARRIFRQTQKKTPEGNKPSFACLAVIGNGNGYVGIGYGKSKDTVPAREKAIRNAKLNIFKIRRGAGSWEDATTEAHSIPWSVEGKCGSARLMLKPAPKGKGLVIEQECAKILKLAGIQNIYSKSYGGTKSKINFIMACVDALKQLNAFKPRESNIKNVHMIEGKK